jgi:CBS domain-containing protein
MTTGVLTLSPSLPLEEAGRTLGQHGIGGAPVTKDGIIVGVLSKTDLVDRWPDGGRLTVADAMTPLAIFVRPDAPASSAVGLMLSEGIHRVLVISPAGELVGIVTSTDVLRALERGSGDLTPAPADGRHADPAVAVVESDP